MLALKKNVKFESYKKCTTSCNGIQEIWHVESMESGKNCMWNLTSKALESGIQYSKFRNPVPEKPEWNPEYKTVLDSLTWGRSLSRHSDLLCAISIVFTLKAS